MKSMDLKKSNKKSKNLKNVLKGSKTIDKVTQSDKASTENKAKVSSAPSDKGSNKNKKAAKLLNLIQGPGAEVNIRIVDKVKAKVKTETDPVEPNASKRKKEKKSSKQVNNAGSKTVAELEVKPKTELGDADRKKIEKKKAKKAAQKLKKAQRKEMLKSGAPATSNAETAPVVNVKKKPNKALKNVLKSHKIINNGNDQKEVIRLKSEEHSTPITSKPTPTEVSDRVMNKKIRKEKKRQNLKAQKLAEKSTRNPAVEEATVFVGNLPVTTKRVQLVRLFEKCGRVNFIRIRSGAGKVLFKHKSRKAAGSLNAYVVLQDKSAVEKALQLNGVEFKGNHLRITKSSKKTIERGDDEEVKRTIFVGNLRYSATEENLREIFSSCGEIEFVRCIRDGDKGCKGVAYVCFKHADAVGLALELKDTILDERPIHVERYSIAKLGAKEQRDAKALKEKKTQLQKPKKGEKKGAWSSNTKKNSKEGDVLKKSKKTEFKGVKVDGLKRKNKNKKAQKSQFSELARKIAPKLNT